MSIKEIINDASVSFEDLCVSTGIPSSTLSDILSGKTELSHCQARTLQKLAKGLGMSMEDVLEMDAVLPDPVEQHPVMVHPVMIPEVFAYYRTSLLEALDETDEELFVIGVAAIVPHNAMADSLMDEISVFVEENCQAEILDEDREIR